MSYTKFDLRKDPKMKIFCKKALSLLLLLVMLVSVFSPTLGVVAAADEAQYKKSLRDAGFPESYLDDLYKLHQKFPDWKFVAMDITGDSIKNKKSTPYTWDYCVYMEGEDQVRRSLIQRSDPALRDWSDPNMYDTGWYKASYYALTYYMDPRNFLDEKQIFQFIDLSFNKDVTAAAVEAACDNSFMSSDWDKSGCAKLDHPTIKTYAEYFVEVGSKVNLNPVYIAACIRNEHGNEGTDSMISGKCGTKLYDFYTGADTSGYVAAPSQNAENDAKYTKEKLEAEFNGYYNYFNFGAAGSGKWTVYTNGMNEAKKGTPELAKEWGGSPSWDKHYKAIYGGAIKASEKYVQGGLNTFYLQKFNVNSYAEGNFWSQYMQNIAASESRTNSLYKAYVEGGILSGAHTFSIPVFEGMPEEKCDDLAQSQIMDRMYLSDAHMAAVGFKIDGKAVKVKSYDTLDMSKYMGQNGMQKGYTIGSGSTADKTITWPVFKVTKDSTLNLGKINLSKYDYALIEYSTENNFVYDDYKYESIIGFVKDSKNPYGEVNKKLNLTSDIGHSVMDQNKFFKKNGGYQFRAVARVDLDTSYNGNVYLTAATQPGGHYLVHNIIFVTTTAHTGTVAGGDDIDKLVTTTPPAVVTTAPVEDVTTAVEVVDTTTVIEDTTVPTDETVAVTDSETISAETAETTAVAESDETTVPVVTDDSGESGGLSVLGIVLIVIGAVVVVAGAVIAVIFIKKKRS